MQGEPVYMSQKDWEVEIFVMLPLLAVLWEPKSHCVEVGSVLVLAGVSPPPPITTEAAAAAAPVEGAEVAANRFLLKWLTFSFRPPVARLASLLVVVPVVVCDRNGDGALVVVGDTDTPLLLPNPAEILRGVTIVSEAECCCRISFWAAGEPVTARRSADPSVSLERDRPDARAPKPLLCCCG